MEPSSETPRETSAEIAARFDERAPRYDDSAMHRALAAAVASSVNLHAVHDVLDIATGTGLVLRALPSHAGLSLTGIDISDGMLTVARTALPTARFIRADAAQLPFADDSFDLIACVTALHLLPDASTALIEWRRVLRPTGRVVLSTFAVGEPTSGRHTGHPVGHGITSVDAHAPFGTRKALTRFAATAGLHVTSVQTWSYSSTPGDTVEHDDVCLIAELSVA